MTTQAIDFGSGIEDAFSRVAAFVPKLIVFLIILIIGYFVAKILAKVVSKVLDRVGFNKAVERGGIGKALESSKLDASDILAKLVFYAIMLFVLSTAFGVFGENPISGYLRSVIAYLPLVFIAIIIVVIASAIAAAVKALIQNSLGGLSYGKILANVVSGLILAFGVIAALNQLNIATNVVNAVLYAALAAIVGIVVVAVGGGGIQPMRERWESSLQKYDEEKPKVAQEAKSAPSVREQAEQAKQKAQQTSSQPSSQQSSSSGSSGGATAPRR
ncbi:hypothetical protein BH24ACT13_BH24ACT13_13440 [soil metagenome]|jgi:hypothetical protein